MADQNQFDARDIGAELLPVITKGIYRDPLDTLREYIQNSIDAQATKVEINVSQDLVSIRDDGTGMAKLKARKAIRLGMSEKDPNKDVGFRGIGIYSAFNICNNLEIYTKPERGVPSKLTFEFDKIRKMLKDEKTRRMNGRVSKLYLEKLLSSSVRVEDYNECPIDTKGTLVIMKGIRSSVYKRLIERKQVIEYLESVVPLPFNPRFKHKNKIEAKFEEEDYRVIKLELSIHNLKEQLYRPYKNKIFTHSQGFGPKFWPIKDIFNKGKLGFAWICLNDARKYLPEKHLRGLVVKKFGFSVGGRDAFAKFFSRAVFNNRVTGEVIITDERLIPNAARTEFEPSTIRDSLYMGFDGLASKISSWANNIQNELKAKEELQSLSPIIFDILKKIPSNDRDVANLLRYNTTLDWYERRINVHKAILQDQQKPLYDKTTTALKQAKSDIKKILASKKQSSEDKRRKRVKIAKTQQTAPAKKELVYGKDKVKNLLEAISLMDMDIPNNLKTVLEYVDTEVLKQKLSDREYSDFLEDLVDYLEENL